ncbi:MAG: hypothetical protein CME61_02250 [Halobacteriovoraceae bacterium]|nr:hypothetical protein [Halobacteriovoraceae bacterium]
MKKLFIQFLSASLLYVNSIYFLPSTAFAIDLTEETKNELIQECMEEYGASEEECNSSVEEVFPMAMEEIENYNDQADAISDGHVFESINILLSAIASSFANVTGLFDGDNYKFPSYYLAAISGIVVFVWYIWALYSFHSHVNKKKEDLKELVLKKSKEIGDSEVALLIQEEELNLLKDMKPKVESFNNCFITATSLSSAASFVALLEAVACAASLGGYCQYVRPKSNKTLDKYLQFLFPTHAHSLDPENTSTDPDDVDQEETLKHASNIQTKIGEVLKSISSIFQLIILSGKTSAALQTDAVKKATEKLLQETMLKLSEKWSSKKAAALAGRAIGRMIVFAVDALGHNGTRKKYANSVSILDQRITELDGAIEETSVALNSESNNQDGSAQGLQEDGTQAQQVNTENNVMLGEDTCYKKEKGEFFSEDKSCDSKDKVTLPKSPKVDTTFIAGKKGSFLSNDIKKLEESLQKSLTTKQGFSSDVPKSLATKAKKLKKGLFKAMREKKIKLKDSKGKSFDYKKIFPLTIQTYKERQDSLNDASLNLFKELGVDPNQKSGLLASTKLLPKSVNLKAKEDKVLKIKKFGLDLDDNGVIKDIKGALLDASVLENYEYKESDIVNKQEESLWRIISIRYRKSGLKRLFKNK